MNDLCVGFVCFVVCAILCSLYMFHGVIYLIFAMKIIFKHKTVYPHHVFRGEGPGPGPAQPGSHEGLASPGGGGPPGRALDHVCFCSSFIHDPCLAGSQHVVNPRS